MQKKNGNGAYLRFEQVMKQRGYNIARVAKAAGIPPSTIYEWKRGTYTPKYEKIAKIAAVLEVPTEYLQPSLTKVTVRGGKEAEETIKVSVADADMVRWATGNDFNRALVKAAMGMNPDKLKTATEVLEVLKNSK